METNREHFFGDKLIYDTITLLTYNEHPRKECRLFKEALKRMQLKEFISWLNSPVDKRFNW